MSNSINCVGRLTRDSELKEVGSHEILEFSLASDVGFGDRKITNFFRCSLWGSRGAKMQQHLLKGKQIWISGELSIRKYEKDGVEKFSHDVNLNAIDFVSGGGNGSDQSAPSQDAPSSKEESEELPF